MNKTIKAHWVLGGLLILCVPWLTQAQAAEPTAPTTHEVGLRAMAEESVTPASRQRSRLAKAYETHCG